MFEKDAEEKGVKYADKLKPSIEKFDDEEGYSWSQVEEGYENGFKDGAEFGYNKANKWHYVKDGDLPKNNKQCLVLFYYNYKGKKEMTCGVKDNLHSDFEIHRCYTKQIIAWKEIEIPEGVRI